MNMTDTLKTLHNNVENKFIKSIKSNSDSENSTCLRKQKLICHLLEELVTMHYFKHLVKVGASVSCIWNLHISIVIESLGKYQQAAECHNQRFLLNTDLTHLHIFVCVVPSIWNKLRSLSILSITLILLLPTHCLNFF